MKLLDVYDIYPVTLTRGIGCQVFDEKGQAYLDLYGGHAVISIGHAHPHYNDRLKKQLDLLAYYSNAVRLPLQEELAEKLTSFSGLHDFRLFLCNSGAEANENALKLASFATGKSRVIAFHKSFHGRTSAAVNATDNPAIKAPVNTQAVPVTFLDPEETSLLEAELSKGDVCAVIMETIQGVGGLNEPSVAAVKAIRSLCTQFGALMIADEIQCGYGRTGDFFAFSKHQVIPDLVTVAKGMGNGFPLAGVLVAPEINVHKGMLGTTFGGNPLACAAGLAVLEVLESENLLDNARKMGAYLEEVCSQVPGVCAVKGRGLMIGLQFEHEVASLRKALVQQEKIFTGGSSDKFLMRILPPLSIGKNEIEQFAEALNSTVNQFSER